MVENFLESLLEAVDIVVDQMLSVDLALVDQTHQCQTLVHLSQVQDDVFLVVSMGQSND